MSEVPEIGEVHREIQDVITLLIQDGEDGQEPAVFDQEALEQITAAVDFYIDTPNLIDAVESVLVIAHLLELEKESPNAAGQLVHIVDREVLISSMKRLNRTKDEDRADGVKKTAEEFTKFSAADDKSSKTAPKGDEEAPKGSLKLNTLDFPKRM